MILKSILLQNFRSYSQKEFQFGEDTTIIIGANTVGKTNLIEAIFFVAQGRSFRVDKDEQLIKFEKSVARIKGKTEDKDLEAVIVQGGMEGRLRPFKKYLVNGVSKRKIDFIGNFFAVLFAPSDLDIIIGNPSKRRDFIDNVLSQVDKDYRQALTFYQKGLRIRNALLHKAKEEGRRSEKEFLYWDNLLINQGQKLTRKREDFITYLENSKKEILNFEIFYDKSAISRERLLQYKEAEVGAGVTLVGPHRDDFYIRINANDIRYFGSRGQQRLAILQLKLLELAFIQEKTEERSVLLLDDIFSELDEEHINLVLGMIGSQQTIITTTHLEFIPKKILKEMAVISLDKEK
ncbi:MAG: DNA replication and repair protein RecF [Candidatus Levybacteria bacterium]|nr:DNA replication and repair protein RecF [Candidatus Levybacteria bacterium]